MPHLFAETVAITDDGDLRDARNSGVDLPPDVRSLRDVIDTAFRIIRDGNYQPPADPRDGTVVADAQALVRYQGRYEIQPVRVAVYDPTVMPRAHGLANQARRLAAVFHDPRQPSEDFRLYVTLVHEITHLIDRQLVLKLQKQAAADPNYHSPEAARWRAGTRLDRPLKGRWTGDLSRPERLAHRTGFAYELARRLAARPPDEARRTLAAMTPERLVTLSPSLVQYYRDNPDQFHRLLSDTWRYLQQNRS